MVAIPNIITLLIHNQIEIIQNYWQNICGEVVLRISTSSEEENTMDDFWDYFIERGAFSDIYVEIYTVDTSRSGPEINVYQSHGTDLT